MSDDFLEQFPELWKELQKETPVDKIKFNADWGNPRIIAARIDVFKKMERLIQKHCLSKSKVREAIEKLSYETSAYVNGNWMKVIRKDVLLKELNLNEVKE